MQHFWCQREQVPVGSTGLQSPEHGVASVPMVDGLSGSECQYPAGSLTPADEADEHGLQQIVSNCAESGAAWMIRWICEGVTYGLRNCDR